MKRLLASIAFSLIMLGCATFGKPVELTAQYFRTIETKTHYVTEEFKPEADVFWVSEEKRNGDNVEVAIVWIDEVNTAIAVAFDDLTMPEVYDYCGILWFQSPDDMNAMLNKFDTSKIAEGQAVPCGQLLNVLGQQIEVSPQLRTDVATE